MIETDRAGESRGGVGGVENRVKISLEGSKRDWTLQSLHTTSKVQWKDGCRSWNSLGSKKSGSAGSQAKN